ncbi:MAG: hypothetical protein ABW185_03325, partial [Sedimenticola sp.]
MPLALFNIDGTMNTGKKSDLLHELEDKVPDGEPTLPKCQDTMWVFDFMAVIQIICGSEGSHSRTVGDICDIVQRLIVSKFTDTCTVVAVVTDRYDKPNSIKAGERSRRSLTDTLGERVFRTRQTKLPNNKKKLLGNA